MPKLLLRFSKLSLLNGFVKNVCKFLLTPNTCLLCHYLQPTLLDIMISNFYVLYSTIKNKFFVKDIDDTLSKNIVVPSSFSLLNFVKILCSQKYLGTATFVTICLASIVEREIVGSILEAHDIPYNTRCNTFQCVILIIYTSYPITMYTTRLNSFTIL